MKAYELLDSPEKWTQRALARDADGREVDPTSADAVCWCMEGAFIATHDDEKGAEFERLRATLRKYGEPLGSPWIFNDDAANTYEEVIAVLKEADV